ncbi:DUF2878 domain-containing protein [Methylotuvimicrobium sp. KM1]|uniref:DUF2878 domain-containing protein n=1 Tax=Methylotuvimicrobium sp. KM1 TaxID=3377707 RepID=UPI00384D1D3E
MNRNNLINMAWMQGLWFAAVLSAASNQYWPAPVILVLFGLWHIRPAIHVAGDFRLVPAALVLGMILDSAWIRLGWLQYASPWPNTGYAPLWILLLWFGLALTLNHSLAWLQSRLWLAGLLGGITCPFSYWAAARLGALNITENSGVWIFGLALSWAAALPLLLWMARVVRQKNHPLEAKHV